jgi:hypothetical protein
MFPVERRRAACGIARASGTGQNRQKLAVPVVRQAIENTFYKTSLTVFSVFDVFCASRYKLR